MPQDYHPSQEVIDYMQRDIDRSKNPDRQFFSAGNKALSLKQLLEEVRLATPLGRELETFIKREKLSPQPGE